jgi:hypothetical protein
MTKRILQLSLFLILLRASAFAQINCATSVKLACQIPYSTGIYGHSGSTVADANNLATVFNSAIATQVSQLPLASASSGSVLLYVHGVGTPYDNLGPVLTDRAEAVGKENLFLAFTASQFYFTDIDGINLHTVPFSYAAANFTGAGTTYVQESLNIHFKVDQYVAYATYGATNKLDLSVIVPITRVSIGSTVYDITQYVVLPNGDLNYITKPQGNTTPGTASGIGDITFNAKYVLLNQELAKLALGFNVRTPTGDALNYLGAGAWGFNPYAVFSYFAKTSPHVRVGYQWNTDTVLYPNLTVGHGNTNLALPGGLQYDFGVDRALVKGLTVAADLLGNQYQNAQKLVNSNLSFTCIGVDCGAKPVPPPPTVASPTVNAVNSTYWINDVSAGAKWNPWRSLILTGNVLFQLNNVGMRARPTPLFGISYKFDFSSKPASKAP